MYDAEMRPMFRDFDAVKAAWNELVERNSRKSRYSIKGSENARDMAKLREENDLLRERVEYWKGQTRRTKRVTTDKKAVVRAANGLIRSYHADLNADDIAGDLQSLYDYIASGSDGKDELTGTEAYRRAENIARRLIESAVEKDDEQYQAYSELRKYLRDTKITISEDESHDITDFNDFRKRNMGRMNVSRGRTNIDQVYQELSERWPEFFDEQRENNPADQLLHIADVMEGIYTITERNPYSEYMDYAVTGAANEIMETFFDLPQTKATFADRQARNLDDVRAAGQQRVQKLREENRAKTENLRQNASRKVADTKLADDMYYGRKLAELRQQNQQRVQKLIEKEQLRRENQIDRLKERYQEKEEVGRERRNARELRAKIVRHANALSQKLLRPSDKQHIPESLRQATASVLEAINLESAYSVDPATGKRVKDGTGTPTKRTEAFRALKEQYAKIVSEGVDMVIDPSLLGSDADGIQGSFDAVISMKDTKLSDMSVTQLQFVWQVVKAVEHSVNTAGKVLSKTKYAKTADWAQAISIDTGSRRAKTSLTRNHALIDLETPYTFFSHYGEAGKAVYRMLRDAQDQQQIMVNHVTEEVHKIVDPKTVKKLEETTRTFTTERGDELTLSTAQIMELYELMKRKQAHDHLLKGGVVQPEVKSAKIRRGTDSILLTENDLAEIAKTLTPEQVKIADGLQGLTCSILADYGNRASMQAYGYRKFTEKDYWPIKSAKEGLHSNIEKGGNSTRSIKNIGMAKTTMPHASNALDLAGIFTTFSNHAADMTDYASWLCTMEDINRLFNYQFRDDKGNPTGKTIKGLLDRVGGPGSQKYWHNLMEDIQNGITAINDSTLSAAAAKMTGNVKAAAVGANIRVIMQQPTAYTRASLVLSPANLARGLTSGATKGNGWKKALKYAPIAMRKDIGGFDISSPRQMKEILFDGRSGMQKFNDAMGWGAGKADAVTWGKLWNACEWAVAREQTNIKKGSNEFYSAVSKRFTEVIDQTQVVDGVLQRSQVMRSNNAVTQQASSFMGEPIMSINMVMRAYDHLLYEQDAVSRGKAIKFLSRAVTVYLVNSAVNAIAQSLIDAIRDDDEDKKYWERFLSAFTGLDGSEENMADKARSVALNGNLASGMNPMSAVPYLSDLLSIIQGYSVERLDMSGWSDLFTAGQTFVESFSGTGKKTPAYAFKQLFTAGTRLFGNSAMNIGRDIWGAIRSAAVESDNIPFQYEMEKAVYNISNSGNKGRYYDILFRALKQGDLDSYQHIRSDLMDRMGVDGPSIDSAMRIRYDAARKKDSSFSLSRNASDLIGWTDKFDAPKKEETFGADDLDAGSYQAYSSQKADTYREIVSGLESSRGFGRLSGEDKNKALTAASSLSEDIALRDHSGGQFTDADLNQWERWASGGDRYGVDETEAILFKLAYEMAESEKDKNGKTISGSKKENTLENAYSLMPNLNDRELAYLMSIYWTPEDEKLKELRDNKFIS